jgi:hypothetical protein
MRYLGGMTERKPSKARIEKCCGRLERRESRKVLNLCTRVSSDMSPYSRTLRVLK